MMDNKGVVTQERLVPQFENEADEAQWWFDNKELIEKDFIEAFEKGTIKRGRAATYEAGRGAASPITLDPVDEKLASALAAKHGESFEGFIRRVVHQALELEKTA